MNAGNPPTKTVESVLPAENGSKRPIRTKVHCEPLLQEVATSSPLTKSEVSITQRRGIAVRSLIIGWPRPGRRRGRMARDARGDQSRHPGNSEGRLEVIAFSPGRPARGRFIHRTRP